MQNKKSPKFLDLESLRELAATKARGEPQVFSDRLSRLPAQAGEDHAQHGNHAVDWKRVKLLLEDQALLKHCSQTETPH